MPRASATGSFWYSLARALVASGTDVEDQFGDRLALPLAELQPATRSREEPVDLVQRRGLVPGPEFREDLAEAGQVGGDGLDLEVLHRRDGL